MSQTVLPAEREGTRSFWKAGHNPTLLAAFLYFDVSFMVWVMLGPLAPIISAELGLDPAEKGLMVAVPTLAGALLRLVNGVLVDSIGPKLTGTLNQLIVMAGLLVGWWFGIDSFAGTIAIGVILGFAGASFAVALPLASRWYPAEHQGKAMGLAGMGNSGTVFAALFAPILAKLFGWNAVLGLAVIPLAVVFVAYQFLAKDSPDQPAPKSLATLHAFNGWADLFLTTPANGLRDYYAGIGKAFALPFLPGLKADVTYHEFDSDFGGFAYGSEWDASLGLKLGPVGLLAKYADYDAAGFGTDTRKVWLQAEVGF